MNLRRKDGTISKKQMIKLGAAGVLALTGLEDVIMWSPWVAFKYAI